jgi:hypothetical protein
LRSDANLEKTRSRRHPVAGTDVDVLEHAYCDGWTRHPNQRDTDVVWLGRHSDCTVIVDRNERFPELQAAMFQGVAVVLEDTVAENADPHLGEVRAQMGRKYSGGHGGQVEDDPPPNAATAAGSNGRWMVFTPQRLVSWDNFKIAGLRNK